MEKETNKLAEGLDEASELEELRHDKALKENLDRELSALLEAFPDLKVDDIPDEIFESCKDGKGLAGEYALWYIKSGNKRAEAERTNESNSRSAPPEIRDGDGELYFTPEAVRTMSQKDVRRNFKAIMKSMEKWK